MIVATIECIVGSCLLIYAWYLLLKKISGIPRNANPNISQKIRIVPLETMEQIEKLLTWYPKGDPLSEALEIGSEVWINLARSWCKRCPGNGLSFVAMSGADIVGGIVIEKFGPLPDIEISEKMGILMALLDETEKKTLETLEKKGKDMYRLVFAVADPSMWNRGVITKLARHLWTHSRDCIFFMLTSSEYSRWAALSEGMTEAHSIRCDTWEYNGTRPFKNVKPPHVVSSIFYLEVPIG
jgi:hypothetical protein